MGRPASFNRDKVLDQATQLFWRRGYLGTSISDLVKETELKPGSLYNAFDSKQTLLLAALERYAANTLARTQSLLQSDLPVLAALEQLVLGVAERCAEDEEGKGCLMLNIWQELSAHDPKVTGYLDGVFARQEAMIRQALEEAQQRGELREGSDPAALAKYLLMSLWGLRLMSRTRPGAEVLRTLAATALQPLRKAFVHE